jgi:(4-(4-[2-(gamma-L-glutamylamino)ethyl]phenoxymethyl)furan-2-yl)methanamine synthase
MATPTILGLDIGGANLKAATPDKRAISVPFALWKQPDKLPAALAELVARFPDVEELAVTMTGELCDCYETKREGVSSIIAAVRFASAGRRIRVWSTDGVFVNDNAAKLQPVKVASGNWHASATLAGQYVPNGRAILIDVGSTTTDIIPVLDGVPVPEGKTDYERITSRELVYTGVRRTPVCSILGFGGAAELFATMLDVYLTLGMIPEDPADCDTADGRPATKSWAHARLCRMLGGDTETITQEKTSSLAEDMFQQQTGRVDFCLDRVADRLARMPSSTPWDPTDPAIIAMMKMHPELRIKFLKSQIVRIVAGSGEFITQRFCSEATSLTDRLGPQVSACAPAYAVATLAAGNQRPVH